LNLLAAVKFIYTTYLK